MATHSLSLHAPAQPAPQTLIPRIEADPRVVAFAQTAPGKIAMLACAAVLFYVRGVRDPVVLVVLAGIFFLPRHTWTLMAIGGIYWMPSMVSGGLNLNQRILGTVLAAAVVALLWVMVQRWPTGWLGRSSRLALLGVFAAAVGAALIAPAGPSSKVLWPLAEALSAFLWIFSFALTDRAALGRADVSTPSNTFWPNAAMFFSFFPECSPRRLLFSSGLPPCGACRRRVPRNAPSCN